MAEGNEARSAQQLQPVVVGNAGPAILGIKFNDLNGDGIRQPNEQVWQTSPFSSNQQQAPTVYLMLVLGNSQSRRTLTARSHS